MNVDGKHYRTIWLAEDGRSVEIIDQTKLPHEFAIVKLTTLAEAADAIRNMLTGYRDGASTDRRCHVRQLHWRCGGCRRRWNHCPKPSAW